jgi:hypothetical protein
VLVAVFAASAPTAAAPDPDVRATLEGYARDTWQSFVKMTDPTTGLPADNISADTEVPSRYTSPTNVAGYLWATMSARELRIISAREATQRMSRTLATLSGLERHAQSGQFYNWYNPQTGQKLRTWPVDGSTVYPFMSSVDNGWLAAALLMVTRADRRLHREAQAIYDSMDFGFYYDPAAGLIRGGFWDELPPGCSTQGNYRGGTPVYYTCHHYGAFNTEPRIASYIGIAEGQIPPTHYFKGWRTFPATCDWSWQEMQPQGVTRTYLDVDVFEGHYTYRGINLVPTWGGSMFEALMVPLLVPEEEWGPQSWAVNHPLFVRAQIEHGLEEAGYGYWGFSPSNNPAGGYREYGVDPIGLEPNGYASDQERTHVDYGFGDCPGRPALPPPTDYGHGVVTPHASFLAIDFDREAAMTNLANLREDFDAYGWGGFYDAIDVVSGVASRYYLALDQGMIIVALANELRQNRIQRYFSEGFIERALRPLMAMEQFTAG